jgi:penicillin-binding protein 1B
LASQSPVVAARGNVGVVEAPYFVDLASDALQTRFPDVDLNSLRVYTTLDMRLQRVADDAIRNGMRLVDSRIQLQERFHGQEAPSAQVALVVLDPHSGEVKALAGGRNYGTSQLNRALARRPPGSIFKPFVYAAAFSTAVDGGKQVLTASSMVADEPAAFSFGGTMFTPANSDDRFHGKVTLRDALTLSLNVATVKVAEMVGYDDVVKLANRAGISGKMQAGPQVALGEYEMTPLEAAAAYTIFANGGNFVRPSLLRLVRGNDGKRLFQNKADGQHALDPRVAYLMTDVMQTGLGKNALDFPAAGATGLSHDGWFVGYTPDLLCAVWVGFDDYRELKLDGAESAGPIWAEFMKGAVRYSEYGATKAFTVPEGVVAVSIDAQSGLPANSGCPKVRREVYIAGTQPSGCCPLHKGTCSPSVAPTKKAGDQSKSGKSAFSDRVKGLFKK